MRYWLTSWRSWHGSSHWDQSWLHNKNWHLHHNKQSSDTADSHLLSSSWMFSSTLDSNHKIIVLRSWMSWFDQMVVFAIKAYTENSQTVDSWIFSCCWSWNIYSPRTVIWSDRCCFALGQNPINLSISSHIELRASATMSILCSCPSFQFGSGLNIYQERIAIV